MTIIQVKTHKLYIIKKRSNNNVSFVEFIFNSKQFKLMTTGSQLHGARCGLICGFIRHACILCIL